MRFVKAKSDNTSLLVNESETKPSSTSPDYRESFEGHTSKQDNRLNSKDKPSSLSESVYKEVVKALSNTTDPGEQKRLLKRASWGPSSGIQDHGLPPTGKRTDNEQSTRNKNTTRIRIRPKVTRYFQPQQQTQHHYHQIPIGRPLSFNERLDRPLVDPQTKKNSSTSHVSSLITN